jgi:hypothetical protein
VFVPGDSTVLGLDSLRFINGREVIVVGVETVSGKQAVHYRWQAPVKDVNDAVQPVDPTALVELNVWVGAKDLLPLRDERLLPEVYLAGIAQTVFVRTEYSGWGQPVTIPDPTG